MTTPSTTPEPAHHTERTLGDLTVSELLTRAAGDLAYLTDLLDGHGVTDLMIRAAHGSVCASVAVAQMKIERGER